MHRDTRGFTLIELLVVIAIIGILAGIILVDTSTSRAKSRDSQRLSNMHDIQTALEEYYNDVGGYPDTLTFGGPLVCNATTYLASIPKDPGGNVYNYSAQGNSSSIDACGDTLTLWDNYNITFTTEQNTALGDPGTYTLDPSGMR